MVKAREHKSQQEKPKSCKGQVFNFKFTCFWYKCMAHLDLEFKTEPTFYPPVNAKPETNIPAYYSKVFNMTKKVLKFGAFI